MAFGKSDRPVEDVITTLSWQEDAIERSLLELYQFCERNGLESKNWYLKRKRWPARISRVLRIFAVIFFTAGGLAPIVKSTFPKAPFSADVDIAQLGYFFLAFAAACLAADRYLGFSNAWSRSILASTAIGIALDDFRLNWIRLTAIRRGQRPDNEQITGMMELCKALNTSVQKIIQEETLSWDKELKSLQEELNSKATRKPEAQ